MYFQMYKDSAGEFRWRLRAANHRTVADSGEGYSSKASCERAIANFKANVSSARVDDETT